MINQAVAETGIEVETKRRQLQKSGYIGHLSEKLLRQV